jgi:hypothetical protein
LEIKEEEKQKAQPEQSLVNDIGTVLRFVEEDFGGSVNSLQSLLSKGEITFDLLWAIFPPSELIIAMEHGVLRQPQALNILTAEYGSHQNGQQFFSATGKIITHDGQDFGRGSFVPTIQGFEGSRKLTTLAFFPIRFHPDEDKLRQRLIARGKKYMAFLNGPVCREYTMQYAVAHPERDQKDPEKISVSVPCHFECNSGLTVFRLREESWLIRSPSGRTTAIRISTSR